MFGKYIAYKMHLPFCYLNISRVIDSYMGATSRNVAQAFTYASANPCIFMLDEVDSISCNREKTGNGSADKEMSRITITLMQELDKVANDIVVIAATNRLDILDEAFVSRCSQRYEMMPFSFDENISMIKMFLKDIGIQISIDEIASQNNQRYVMNRLVRKIASILVKENELL